MVWVYVFHGAGARFAGGVFSSKESAVAWIANHRLTGLLTAYPVDQGVFDYCVAEGKFTPKRDEHREPSFIGRFTSAMIEHYHFEDGSECGTESS